MIEFIYLLASGTAIAAMAPQVKQLLVHKDVSSLSLTSWVIWTVAQAIATVYGISIGALPYVIISSIWLTYYGSVVGIILYYQRPRTVAVTEQAENRA